MAYQRTDTWSNLIHPGMAGLITGHRRKGKTGLGYYLLELCYIEHQMPCYVVELPVEKEIWLPYFITNIPFSVDLPEDSAIFIDEAALEFYAREHQKDANKEVSKVLGAAGQRGQIIIFATHHTRKLDVNVVLDLDFWAFKKPSKMHIRLERNELKPIVEEACEIFDLYVPRNDKTATVVMHEDYEEYIIVYNDLPSYWNDELSEPFRGVSLVKEATEGEGEPPEESPASMTSIEKGMEIHYLKEHHMYVKTMIEELLGLEIHDYFEESEYLDRMIHVSLSRRNLNSKFMAMGGRIKPRELIEKMNLLGMPIMILIHKDIINLLE